MANNTEFSQPDIDKVAQKQDEEMGELRNQLKSLHADVQLTLDKSTSDSTKALETVYSQWFTEVDQFIVDRTNLLSQTMTNQAAAQVAADQENSQTISAIAGFLR